MNEKILVVDDSKFARVFLKKVLINGNFTNIFEAANAADTIKIFEQEKPDLVFLDISLPDSNDLGLLEKLLKINPDAKIVMCSALGQDLIIEEALKKGAIDFVVKPFEEKQMLETVMKLLHHE